MFTRIGQILQRLLLVGIALASLLNAETPEQVLNPKTTHNEWVSDLAEVINETTERQLNSIIDQLEQKTTAEIAVVTIQRSEGHSPKKFATELFNRWGIGKAGKDNGVLVLLVMDARRIEVETGYGIEGTLTDGKVGEILDHYVIPKFKKRDFGGGLLAGVQQTANTIAGKKLVYPEAKEPRPGTAEEKRGDFQRVLGDKKNPFYTGIKFLLLLALLLVLLTGFVIYFYYVRFCPQCRKKMRRLSEEQDDAYLAADQKFEEDIDSINYRVWRCDDCQIITVSKNIRMFSDYTICPKCKNRTLTKKSIRLREPTYFREGKKEIRYKCSFSKCGYSKKELRIIPIRFESSSSSGGWSGGSGSWGGGGGFSGGGGSFGGGSSGGGGAGRSW
jgi:uncharacterized protein